MLLVAAWVAGAFAGATHAQGEPRVLAAEAGDPQPWVRAEDLARLVGASLDGRDGRLVLRTADTTLTVFVGSADALIAGDAATEAALSAPVRVTGGEWWLPLDAGAPFGIRQAAPGTVVDAEGRSWTLDVAPPAAAASDDPRARVLRPAAGVVALELRDAPDSSADRAVWIADLALVPLARPELRALVDDALRDAGAARALLIIATSRRDGARFEGISVASGDRELVPVGARHDTLVGVASSVGPGAPWIAVVWLPPGTRLDLPLRIAWEGAAVEVVLRY